MPKATIELPSGSVVTIEGTPDEVQELLEFYASFGESDQQEVLVSDTEPRTQEVEDEPNLTQIINLIKTCEEAEQIETQILDRTGEVNRVLLPLYIIQEYLDNKFGLTTIEISKITADLGVRVLRSNASRALTGPGSRYVIADRVRRRGVAARYSLNRRGLQYMKTVIHGESNDE